MSLENVKDDICPQCGSELRRRGQYHISDEGEEIWDFWNYYCVKCPYDENQNGHGWRTKEGVLV